MQKPEYYYKMHTQVMFILRVHIDPANLHLISSVLHYEVSTCLGDAACWLTKHQAAALASCVKCYSSNNVCYVLVCVCVNVLFVQMHLWEPVLYLSSWVSSLAPRLIGTSVAYGGVFQPEYTQVGKSFEILTYPLYMPQNKQVCNKWPILVPAGQGQQLTLMKSRQ